MGGEAVAFEAAHVAVQLYYGNVTVQYADAAELRAAAEAYGPVETAFIVHNPDGVTKVCHTAVLVARQLSRQYRVNNMLAPASNFALVFSQCRALISVSDVLHIVHP